jgi:CBS domain-containing protein
MTVIEFLKHARQRLVTCGPDESIEEVAKRLHAHNIGAMPVCEGDRRIVGIISERDLVRAIATKGYDLRRLKTSDLMTAKVVSCGVDENMRAAQELMRTNRFRHLPVVEDGRVLGMLSIRDTLAMRLQESEFEINVLRDVVVAARNR